MQLNLLIDLQIYRVVLKNANIIIGGEYLISPAFLFKRSKGYIDSLIREFKDDYEVNFTFGGYYSILAIIDSVKSVFDNNSVVLLPSYLCPSILHPFKSREIKYRFYKIDENLFVDIDYLISIIDDNVKAILFIDYFGVTQMKRLQPLLAILKSKKITIIQDIVQCLKITKDQLFGDYIFNSFRKFSPFEGSILLSKAKMHIDFSDKKNKFITYKRVGQFLRYFHVRWNLFSSRHFLYYFRKADEYYVSDYIIGMSKFNYRQLNKIDIEFMTEKQIYYYSQLFDVFNKNIPDLFRNINSIPLGFVIKITQRNQIRKDLFKQNIFPPIHWVLPEELDKTIFFESIKLSSVILTIPLIGLTDKGYRHLYSNMIKFIKN
jgi:hypothetical protein